MSIWIGPRWLRLRLSRRGTRVAVGPRRSLPLRDQIYLPGRWSWKTGLDSWVTERAIQKSIKAHADRAAIIRDFFVDAYRGYQDQGLTKAGRA